MTDKKLTDEEIIKALTELSRYTGFQEKYIQVLNATLDLINRQKTEIEQLKEEAKDKLKAEAYKEFAERLKQSTVMAVMGNKIYAVATSKGVDNLLKEMVGEEE